MQGWFRRTRFAQFLAAALVISAWGCAPSNAQALATLLLDIRQGPHLSEVASGLRNGGYELSEGTRISFVDWYRTDWLDLHIDMLTPLSEDAGILWGISSGERGEKYMIAPSLKLGFVSQVHPREHSTLALSATTIIGGSLTELPCEADYGDIGGVQAVNCRLAAIHLEPSETLQYLVNAEPTRLHLTLSYRARF
jgi:hypothetical protein